MKFRTQESPSQILMASTIHTSRTPRFSRPSRKSLWKISMLEQKSMVQYISIQWWSLVCEVRTEEPCYIHEVARHGQHEELPSRDYQMRAPGPSDIRSSGESSVKKQSFRSRSQRLEHALFALATAWNMRFRPLSLCTEVLLPSYSLLKKWP